MSLGDAIDDVLMWTGRALAVLPAFKAFWQAVAGADPDQEFAAAMEFKRVIRRELAKAELLRGLDEP